jgi:argininosuccinate lyase
MKKNISLWGGRFSDNQDSFMLEFGASIDFDIKLFEVDIQGSIAWAEALEKAGIISKKESETITGGLMEILVEIKKEIENGTFVFDKSIEDIHMTVEKRLTDKIGDTGAKLHTGRSRNDQVALDERMYLLGAIKKITGDITEFQRTIVAASEKYADTIIPAYTHLQQAQPVYLGHYLMSWFWMMERDKRRFIDSAKRTDFLPLGSGAVAGSGFEIDRRFLAEKLGFSGISENSMDAVSDRDYIIEFISAASILMMHLSRISEDLIIWSSVEFGFAELSERYSTGSSMMPQKKNPDSLELVRGKTGRVFGNLTTILTIMKGLPFSYCKDMQEDKEPMFDSIDTVIGCLRIINGVLSEISFKKDRFKQSIDDKIFATDIADYLTRKHLPFRKAHEIAGKLVKWSIENKIPMGKIPFEI